MTQNADLPVSAMTKARLARRTLVEALYREHLKPRHVGTALLCSDEEWAFYEALVAAKDPGDD